MLNFAEGETGIGLLNARAQPFSWLLVVIILLLLLFYIQRLFIL